MKSLLRVLSISFALIMAQQLSVAQWVSSSTGITVNSMYCFEKVGSTLYVSTEGGGVFVSTDNGSNWAASNTGLTSLTVVAILASGSNLFAGTAAGVFLSTNGGSSWTVVNTGLTASYVYALAANGGNIYAGTGSGVFKSTNNGANWTASNSGITNLSINALASSGANLFAGTNNGIFLSTNLGTSWNPVNTGLTFTFITALFAHGTNIYAATSSQGVFLSTNNGGNWTQRNTGLTSLATTGFASSGSNVFCSTYFGVFLSTNNGTTWSAANTGLTGISIYTMTVFGPYAYAGTLSNKVFRRPLSEMVSVPFEITSFTPSSGSAGADVIINGTGFSGSPQGTIVRFGTAQATVSNVTATTITAQAPPNATYGPITVTTANKNAASRNPFLVTFGGGGFGGTSWDPNIPLGMTSNSQSVAFADLDGDTRLDIILPQYAGSTVRVARNASTGTGDFTFNTSTDVGTGWLVPRGVVTADFDGDGKLDIVTACTGAASPGRVSILKNLSTSGSLTFAAGVVFRDTTDFLYIPYDVAVGDFDGDGKTDIATASQLGSSFWMHAFRNVGSVGSITASSLEHPVKFAAGSNARKIRTADIDGDGKLDIVVLTADGATNAMYVYRNTTTGSTISFAAAIDLPMNNGAVDVSLGDLNADGKPDMLVLNSVVAGASFDVLQNNSTIGAIAFGNAASVTMPENEFQCAIGDVDGDARPDVLVISAGRMYGFRNLNTGGTITTQSFDARVTIGAITSATSSWFAAADLDRDSKPEIVVAYYSAASNNVVVLKNRISPGFTPTPIPTGTNADLDGVSFIDRNRGCIAGRGGIVRITTDGGLTWTGSPTGTSADLTDIDLIGSKGFITGNGGLICVSTDGGGSWVPFTTGTSETFNGSSFTSETAGWAVGTGGIICVFNGTNWTPQPTGTTIEFKSVFGLGSTGWAVGANGTICRYIESSWVPQATGTTVTFNDVAFADANTGFAVGQSATICKTTNGGTTWTPINTGYSGLNIRSIKIANANLAWATADGGVVLQTADGGATWTSTYLGSANLKGIEFVGGRGIIVGDGGTGYSFQTDLVSVRENPATSGIPTGFALNHNYPNPFNPTTTIQFAIPAGVSVHTSLRVYDILGREVSTLINEEMTPGNYDIAFDARGFASGTYVYQLRAGSFVSTKKLLLLK